MSFETAIQSVIFPALNTDSTLLGLIDAVYDHVPQSADFPYVVIGEDSLTEWDTDAENGANVTITIHVWSRDLGRAEVKVIQGAIYNALHLAQLSISGYKLGPCQFVGSDSLLDYDGLTRHGIQTFQVFIEATS